MCARGTALLYNSTAEPALPRDARGSKINFVSLAQDLKQFTSSSRFVARKIKCRECNNLKVPTDIEQSLFSNNFEINWNIKSLIYRCSRPKANI